MLEAVRRRRKMSSCVECFELQQLPFQSCTAPVLAWVLSIAARRHNPVAGNDERQRVLGADARDRPGRSKILVGNGTSIGNSAERAPDLLLQRSSAKRVQGEVKLLAPARQVRGKLLKGLLCQRVTLRRPDFRRSTVYSERRFIGKPEPAHPVAADPQHKPPDRSDSSVRCDDGCARAVFHGGTTRVAEQKRRLGAQADSGHSSLFSCAVELRLLTRRAR